MSYSREHVKLWERPRDPDGGLWPLSVVRGSGTFLSLAVRDALGDADAREDGGRPIAVRVEAKVTVVTERQP